MDRITKNIFIGAGILFGTFIGGMEIYVNRLSRDLVIEESKKLEETRETLSKLIDQYNVLASNVNQCCPHLPTVNKIEQNKGDASIDLNQVIYSILRTNSFPNLSPLPPLSGYGLFPSTLPGLGF